MPRYSWQDSLITQVDAKENLRYRHAVLRLREDIDADTLKGLSARLQRHGLVAVQETEGEEATPVLYVRNFKKVSDLFNILEKEGLTSGQFSSKEPLEEELNPEVKTLRKYLKEHSIQLAGAVYLIADAMPIASGIVRKTPSEVLSGGLFATTSAALLLFGRKNPQMQMGNLYARMQEFIAQEGVQADENQALALEQLKSDKSYINGLINFLYEHPVLFNNTIQGFGCYQGHVAGRHQKNPWKNIAGLSGAAGQWGGLAIPEDKYAGLDAQAKSDKLKARATGEEKENGFNTSWHENPVAWVREKPLRLTAVGTILQNFLVGASVMFHDRHEVNKYFGYESKKYEWNPARIFKDITRSRGELLEKAGVSMDTYCADKALAGKPWLRKHETLEHEINRQMGLRFTMASPFFNIIANTLYGMSSKEERSVNLDKEGYIDELLGLAANIYQQVPQEQRGEKLVRFAGFLKSQPDVNIGEKEIRARLEQKISELENSAWAGKVANEKREVEQGMRV